MTPLAASLGVREGSAPVVGNTGCSSAKTNPNENVELAEGHGGQLNATGEIDYPGNVTGPTEVTRKSSLELQPTELYQSPPSHYLENESRKAVMEHSSHTTEVTMTAASASDDVTHATQETISATPAEAGDGLIMAVGSNWILDRAKGMTHPVTDIEVIQALNNMFLLTGDINCLECAIVLVEAATAKQPAADTVQFLQSLRASLLGMRSRRPPLEQVTQSIRTAVTATPVLRSAAKVNGVIAEMPSATSPQACNGPVASGIDWIPGSSKGLMHPTERIELVQTLSDTFLATGDINSLKSAIGMVEDMIPELHLVDATGFLPSLLTSLFGMKSRSTATDHGSQATHRVEETAAATIKVGGRLVAAGTNRIGERFAVAANVIENIKVIQRLSNKFGVTGDTDFLDNAIGLTKEMIAGNPTADHMSLLQSILSGLSGLQASIVARKDVECLRTLGNQFDATGDIHYLDSAISLAVRIIDANPSNEKLKSSLSILLGAKYQRTGTLDDLEQAIKQREEILAETPPGHPDRASRLGSSSYYFCKRFERLGVVDDLQRAIQVLEEAVVETPPDSPNRATVLNNLSLCLCMRFERFGALDDLQKAIQAGEEALIATPPTPSERAYSLNNLSCYLSDRFDRLGDPQDHERVVQAREEVLAAIPPGHPERGRVLNNLSKSIFNRFDRLGYKEGLEQAILVCQEAVVATAPNHPDQLMALTNLSGHFAARFERLGALDDLTKAIQTGEKALSATPADHPDRALRLSNMGYFLCNRYVRLGALADIESAIQVAEEALAVTPPDHPGRSRCLNNMSAYYSYRFDQLGDMGDLGYAIKRSQESIAATPIDHPRIARQLNNLGCHLSARFHRTGAMEDLDQAIRASEAAVAATLPNHPTRATNLLQNARYLLCRFFQTNSDTDFQSAINVSLDAWGSRLCSPRIRIQAARFAADLLISGEWWERASVLLEDAVKLLPEVSPQYLARGDQEHILSGFNQLGAEAISVALQVGSSASHCLSLLELGRGIIMGFTIDCRSDLSELRVRDPDSFNKINQLRTQIDAPSAGRHQESDCEQTDEMKRQGRVQAIDEMGEILRHIRLLPGFGGFQLPPSASELIEIAAEGPIIVFNSTEFRSDAIIVSGTGIKSLTLPKLVLSEVKDRMGQLTSLVRGKRSTYPSRNKEMERILIWLWEVAVEPVFEALGLVAIGDHVAVDDSKLPRVWWIGVGPLAIAPFHAAGDHAIGSTRNSLSRVISSYIPTIKALSYAREKRLELLNGSGSRLLLIAMPTTPDTPAVPAVPASPGTRAVPSTPPIPATPTSLAIPRNHGTPAVYPTPATPGIGAKRWKPLKNAIKEVEDIIGIVQEQSCTVTRLYSPNSAQVIKELPAYNVIHFACHGVSDRKNPSNSHLLLRGVNPSEPGILTVGAISNMNIKNAQVAYLSACCTADNPSDVLADESIHIASGFQLAGFSHVLATMWESDDTACRRVAGEFYRSLFNGQRSDQGHRAVSTAFHVAVKNLRKDILGQPNKWASFIHTGA